MKQKLSDELRDNLAPNADPDVDVEEEWARLRDVVYTAASDVVGPTVRKQQDWFDENISHVQSLMEEKHKLHRALLNDPSSALKKDAVNAAKRIVQSELRHMQDDWYSWQADSIQRYAPPTEAEVAKAIKRLSSGKTPGADSIPAEVCVAGGPKLSESLTSLFTTTWTQEKLSQEFKDATIIHLFKCKGSRNSCGNYRGISLLSITGKILARVLLNRLNVHLERDVLPEIFSHDFRSPPTTGEVPGAECWSLYLSPPQRPLSCCCCCWPRAWGEGKTAARGECREGEREKRGLCHISCGWLVRFAVRWLWLDQRMN